MGHTSPSGLSSCRRHLQWKARFSTLYSSPTTCRRPPSDPMASSGSVRGRLAHCTVSPLTSLFFLCRCCGGVHGWKPASCGGHRSGCQDYVPRSPLCRPDHGDDSCETSFFCFFSSLFPLVSISLFDHRSGHLHRPGIPWLCAGGRVIP